MISFVGFPMPTSFMKLVYEAPVKMFQIEFYSGHTEIVFAESKRVAYGKALGMKSGRIVNIFEILVV